MQHHYKLKYTIYIFIIMSILCVGVSSCKKQHELRHINNIKVIKVNKFAHLTESTGSPKCSIEISVSYIDENDSIAKKINGIICKQLFGIGDMELKQATDSFVAKYIHDYKNSLISFYKEDNNDQSKQSWYEYWYKINTDIRLDKDEIITYIITKEIFEGGAHSIKTTTVMNFASKTGDIVKLGDILIPGYEKHLNGQLLEQLKKETGASDIYALRDKGYLHSSDIFIPENFIIGNKGITFIYNPYEIAPYEMGTTELSIEYDNIDNIINKHKNGKDFKIFP